MFPEPGACLLSEASSTISTCRCATGDKSSHGIVRSGLAFVSTAAARAGRTTYERRSQPLAARHDIAVPFSPHALTSWHNRYPQTAPLGRPRKLDHRTSAVRLVSTPWIRIVLGMSSNSASICITTTECAQYRIETYQS